jgi:hypothetical protein
VLGFCGVPTHDENRAPLKRDEKTSKRIAAEAVKKVYQHTESVREIKDERTMELITQRGVLAEHFRTKYGSGNGSEERKTNAYPYFIGAFDTVASLVNPVVATSLLLAGAVAVAAIVWFTAHTRFWVYPIVIGGFLLAWAFLAFVKSLTRSELGLPRRHKLRFFHFVEVHQGKYETHLNPNVAYARHAIAIDERRKAFDKVAWGGSYSKAQEESHSFEQVWFAGDHSDIGGSYHENESRLSDISLLWMLDAAVGAGLEYDKSVLQLYPDPTGPQHDEARSSVFHFFPTILRTVPNDAPLHPSVIERFKAREILDYDTLKAYRPENLRQHKDVQQFYP